MSCRAGIPRTPRKRDKRCIQRVSFDSMNTHSTSATTRSPDGWLRSPLGRYLLAQEHALVGQTLDGVFGHQLLQIGRWGAEQGFLSLSRTQRSALVDQRCKCGACVNSTAEQLAVATHSVDAVLLPHTLERSCAPHQVIREVDRILVGDGHVIILGLNPGGPMGLRRLISGRRFPPQCQGLIRVRRIEDWLKLLGYEIRKTRRFSFGWPMRGLQPRHLEKIESLGARYWPIIGGAYMVHAQTRVYTMTPIRPAVRTRTRVGTGLAEPTVRVLHDN
jgi:SAM-dependent methyltransferase